MSSDEYLFWCSFQLASQICRTCPKKKIAITLIFKNLITICFLLCLYVHNCLEHCTYDSFNTDHAALKIMSISGELWPAIVSKSEEQIFRRMLLIFLTIKPTFCVTTISFEHFDILVKPVMSSFHNTPQ